MATILGIDPGLRATGWGVISCDEGKFEYISHGTIRPKTTIPMAERLRFLYEAMLNVMEECQPDCVSIESVFVNNNRMSSLYLGFARGVLLAAAANTAIYEYSPTTIKKAVTGHGHAKKSSLMLAISKIIEKIPEKLTQDAADAISIALCHCIKLDT